MRAEHLDREQQPQAHQRGSSPEILKSVNPKEEIQTVQDPMNARYLEARRSPSSRKKSWKFGRGGERGQEEAGVGGGGRASLSHLLPEESNLGTTTV